MSQNLRIGCVLFVICVGLASIPDSIAEDDLPSAKASFWGRFKSQVKIPMFRNSPCSPPERVVSGSLQRLQSDLNHLEEALTETALPYIAPRPNFRQHGNLVDVKDKDSQVNDDAVCTFGLKQAGISHETFKLWAQECSGVLQEDQTLYRWGDATYERLRVGSDPVFRTDKKVNFGRASAGEGLYLSVNPCDSACYAVEERRSSQGPGTKIALLAVKIKKGTHWLDINDKDQVSCFKKKSKQLSLSTLSEDFPLSETQKEFDYYNDKRSEDNKARPLLWRLMSTCLTAKDQNDTPFFIRHRKSSSWAVLKSPYVGQSEGVGESLSTDDLLSYRDKDWNSCLNSACFKSSADQLNTAKAQFVGDIQNVLAYRVYSPQQKGEDEPTSTSLTLRVPLSSWDLYPELQGLRSKVNAKNPTYRWTYDGACNEYDSTVSALLKKNVSIQNCGVTEKKEFNGQCYETVPGTAIRVSHCDQPGLLSASMIQEAATAYSKPYSRHDETIKDSTILPDVKKSYQVARPNHGIVHSLRKAYLTEDLLDTILQDSGSSVHQWVKSIEDSPDRNKVRTLLMLGSLWNRSGRESESKNKPEYALAGAQNFKAAALRAGFSETDPWVKRIYHVIMDEAKSDTEKKISKVLHAAHMTELRRCIPTLEDGLVTELITNRSLRKGYFAQSNAYQIATGELGRDLKPNDSEEFKRGPGFNTYDKYRYTEEFFMLSNHPDRLNDRLKATRMSVEPFLNEAKK